MRPYKTKLQALLFLMTSFSCVCHAQTIEIGSTSYLYSLFNVGTGESMIAAFDYNSDGHQDIIVSNYSDNNIVIYRGDGKGNLIETSRHFAGEKPTDLSISDLNVDGNIDVVVANHETSYLTLLYGDGSGEFKQPSHSPLMLHVKPHPHVVQLEDLNGDSYLDIIVDNRSHEALLVLTGLGNGEFKKQSRIVEVGGDPYLGFAVGDINDDGKLDLVTPNQRAVSIVLNNEAEKLSFSIEKSIPHESPFAVELADLTGDGRLDLIIASSGGLITIISGNGQGGFLEGKKTSIRTSSGAKQITVGDINSDGIEDAVISNWSGDILAVLGNKTILETIVIKNPSIPNPWGLVLTDLNEDGQSDLIVADGESQLAAVYISQGQ